MKLLIYLFCCVLTTSCGILNNGVSYSGEEKVFSKQFRNYNIIRREAIGREPGWELGFAFKTIKETRLKGIWLKNPTIGVVPISLWDGDTKQLITTFQFTNSDTNTYNHYIILQPLPLLANKKYCITANVTKYYYHTLPFTNLPLLANNCTLLNAVYEESYYQRYPQLEINNVIHGLLDIDVDVKQ